MINAAETGSLTLLQKGYAIAVGTSTGAMKAFRIALAATGIGLVVVALGFLVEKILQIYGRSFDEIKKFIDGMANMTSVNYNIGNNDIPSLLLKNLADTLGWEPNISPITNENFLDSIFGDTNTITFPGYARGLTPTELNYQYYRNLILNAGYLFRSKGTRRSIGFLLRLVGAPDSVIEFNENIYLADQKINMEQFATQFARISGGTYANEVPGLAPTNVYKIQGQTYTGFTSTTVFENVSLEEADSVTADNSRSAT